MNKNSEYNDKQAAKRTENKQKVSDYILQNLEKGATVTELYEQLGFKPDVTRTYLKDLLADGYIRRERDGKKGFRYFWKDGDTTEAKPEKLEVDEKLGGVERDPDTVIKCGEFCKPGDVVECSSRSGEGLYFKYLVLIPWERKAMVLGIFPEGHPNLNLNDPNHIYIGDDPETSNKLYVDITNVCQRGYKTFGKRFFHVEKEHMDEVKSRLRRVLRLGSVDSSDTISSLNLEVQNKRLTEDNRTLKKIRASASNEILDLKDKLETAKRDLAIQCKQYEQQIDDLKATIMITNGAAQDYESRYTLQKKEIEELKEENHNLTCQHEVFRQQIIEFSHGKEPLDPDYVKGLESRYGDALLMLKEAETKVNCYLAQIEFMRQVIFKSFNNRGGN